VRGGEADDFVVWRRAGLSGQVKGTEGNKMTPKCRREPRGTKSKFPALDIQGQPSRPNHTQTDLTGNTKQPPREKSLVSKNKRRDITLASWGLNLSTLASTWLQQLHPMDQASISMPRAICIMMAHL